MASDDDVEILLVRLPECFVYRLPARMTSGGHMYDSRAGPRV